MWLSFRLVDYLSYVSCMMNSYVMNPEKNLFTCETSQASASNSIIRSKVKTYYNNLRYDLLTAGLSPVSMFHSDTVSSQIKLRCLKKINIMAAYFPEIVDFPWHLVIKLTIVEYTHLSASLYQWTTLQSLKFHTTLPSAGMIRRENSSLFIHSRDTTSPTTSESFVSFKDYVQTQARHVHAKLTSVRESHVSANTSRLLNLRCPDTNMINFSKDSLYSKHKFQFTDFCFKVTLIIYFHSPAVVQMFLGFI